MQARDEAAAVRLLAATGSVAEANDVGAALSQPAVEGQSLRVMHERDEARLAVVVVSHQDGKLTAGGEGSGTIGDEQLVPVENQFWMLVHYAISVLITVAIGVGIGMVLARLAPRQFAFLNGGRLAAT